jgi:hypothetical protein
MGHHLLLVPILFVAVTTIRDDLREGRIFNRRILQGLASGAACYGLLLVLDLAGADPRLCSAPAAGGGWHWGAVALQDLALGLGAGILLWLLGVWAAGDAKLFMVYAFLVPPAIYTRSYLEGFPALPVLVNVFSYVFLFLLVDLVRTAVPAAWRTIRDPARRGRAARAAPRAILRAVPVILLFTAMFAGIRSLREVGREGLQPFLHVSDFTMFLVLFAIFRPLSRIVQNRWGAVVFTALSLAALGVLVWRHGPGHLPHLVMPSVFAVVLLVFARAYPGMGQTTREVRVGDLARGMLLAPATLAALRSREAREAALVDGEAVEEEPGTTPRPSRFGDVSVEGLTDEQVRYVRTRWKDDEPILVARTIPFSPFLAAGALTTYVIGGPLTMFIEIH